MAPLLKLIVVQFIKKGVRKLMFKKLAKKMRGKLTVTSALPLFLGALAGAFGIDLAPAEIDVIVSFVSLVGVVYGRWRATAADPSIGGFVRALVQSLASKL